MSFSRQIKSGGSIKIKSAGILDLEADGSYCKMNSLQLTSPLAVLQGGHGATTAEGARSALGLAIGSNVQAYHAKLADVAGLAPSSGQYVKWNGSNFVADTPAGTNYDADEVTLQENSSVFSIKDGGVASAKLADNAVTSGKLADNAVTNAKMADNAVGTAEIADGAVTGAKIASSITGKTFTSAVTVQSSLALQESGQSGSSSMKLYEFQSTDETAFSLASVAIGFDTALTADVLISCCSDDLSQFASFKLWGAVKNNAGTSSSGAVHDEIVYQSHVSISAVLDVNGNNLRVRCQGKSATNMRWTARVVLVEAPKYVGV
jgi:hypothetical protein